jgi:ArsR family transcriptional regulator
MSNRGKEIYEMHAEICKTFTSPKRLEIIELLRNGEKSVNDISTSTGISQSNVSQHLGLLKDKGVVIARKEATTVYYSIANPKILEACGLMREVLLERIEESKRLSETAKEIR